MKDFQYIKWMKKYTKKRVEMRKKWVKKQVAFLQKRSIIHSVFLSECRMRHKKIHILDYSKRRNGNGI